MLFRSVLSEMLLIRRGNKAGAESRVKTWSEDGRVGMMESREGRHPLVNGVACHIGWSATSSHGGRGGGRGECRTSRPDKSDRAVRSTFKVRSNSMHSLIWKSPARRPVPSLKLAGAADNIPTLAGNGRGVLPSVSERAESASSRTKGPRRAPSSSLTVLRVWAF